MLVWNRLWRLECFQCHRILISNPILSLEHWQFEWLVCRSDTSLCWFIKENLKQNRINSFLLVKKFASICDILQVLILRFRLVTKCYCPKCLLQSWNALRNVTADSRCKRKRVMKRPRRRTFSKNHCNIRTDETAPIRNANRSSRLFRHLSFRHSSFFVFG